MIRSDPRVLIISKCIDTFSKSLMFHGCTNILAELLSAGSYTSRLARILAGWFVEYELACSYRNSLLVYKPAVWYGSRPARLTAGWLVYKPSAWYTRRPARITAGRLMRGSHTRRPARIRAGRLTYQPVGSRTCELLITDGLQFHADCGITDCKRHR